jgi:ParB-like chromosome segregation protein Spo0J
MDRGKSEASEAVEGRGEAAGEWRPTASLRPLPGNPRSHSPAQVRRIAALVERFGWGRTIVIRPDGTILAGHGAWLAAKHLGMARVPVRVLDLDPKASREFALADNARDFGDDDEREVQAILAGADDDFAEILSGEPEEGLEVDDVDVGEVEKRAGEGRFELTVRGPLLAEPEALDRLRAALEDIEGVTVEASWT